LLVGKSEKTQSRTSYTKGQNRNRNISILTSSPGRLGGKISGYLEEEDYSGDFSGLK
jgi:hypothetical protein